MRGEVNEVFAVTDDAHSDLWRVLTNLDLIPSLTATIPVDDPLRHKLINARDVSITGLRDEMWLRILDIPAALGSRKYAADLDAVIESPTSSVVTEGFSRCPRAAATRSSHRRPKPQRPQ